MVLMVLTKVSVCRVTSVSRRVLTTFFVFEIALIVFLVLSARIVVVLHGVGWVWRVREKRISGRLVVGGVQYS